MPKQELRKVIVFCADFIIFCWVALFWWLITQTLFLDIHIVLFNFMALYGCMLLFQVLFRTYDSLWRYAAHVEYFSLLLGGFLGTVLYEVIHYSTGTLKLDSGYVWGVASLTTLGMLAMRFSYRMLRERRSMWTVQDNRKPVAIVGAGAAGIHLLKELKNNPQSNFRPVCFFDDEPGMYNRRIDGIPVMGTLEEIPEKLKNSKIKHIFVAIPSLEQNRAGEVLQLCHQVPGVEVRVLPTTLLELPQFEQKSLTKNLRKVEIGDLLGRTQINLADPTVQGFVTDKVVLITGGGGSIGSELCRQVAAAAPKMLVIVDIYENNAYDIQQELVQTYGKDLNFAVEIASIRDPKRVDELFNHYRPQVVFHAAAHKHVPLMEFNPQEAVRNNVFGTYNLVTAAHHAGVEKFVQISTDKAVNPTNVMGATKRMCEMILQGMQEKSDTEFVAVRFGNVLGSNGSVIPLFQRQIANGGPVTLTDKRITRYFMTIPEAVQLVLQAGAMAAKNQVFVLDMGKPTKIIDLAENLIRLSGYEPYRDIDIKEVGLRPGEKLYEELLVGGKVIETENDLIFVEEQPALTAEAVDKKLELLRTALETRDNEQVVQALRTAVPTFKPPHEVNGPDLETPVPQVEPLFQQRTVLQG